MVGGFVYVIACKLAGRSCACIREGTDCAICRPRIEKLICNGLGDLLGTNEVKEGDIIDRRRSSGGGALLPASRPHPHRLTSQTRICKSQVNANSQH